ncbi:MAG: hypothetical protein FD126_1777 [Elusimicrobia bacterium]|nr:MAG: hypothetical protein FD126_1777 [Elusimicrobiota bacterium]
MAPNPSAALRVVLAASIAVGSLPRAAYAVPVDYSSSDILVIRVGDAVPIYQAMMVRTKDLAGLKAKDERDVEVLIPKQMKNLQRVQIGGISIPYAAFHYGVEAQAEKVKLKLIEDRGSFRDSRWQVARKGQWIAGKDKEPATFPSCRPNGDWHCFSRIHGIPRKFTINIAPAESTPPQPVPPQPVPPQPVPPQPVPPQPVPPVPPREQPGPDTLKDWSFVPNEDGTVLAVGKATYEGAKARGAACPAGFVTVPVYKLAFADDDKDKPLTAAAEDQGRLKFYKTAASGQPVAQCPKGKDCEAEGTDMRLSAFCPDAAQCPKLTINRPKGQRAGTPFTADDLPRTLQVKLGATALSGKAVVEPTVSKDCTGTTAPPAPPDPHAADLKKLLGDDEAALTLAKLAQRVWQGEPTFAATLAEALKNPDAAKGKAAFLAKAQAAILAEDGKRAIAALKDDAILKQAFNTHHCKKAPTPAAQPVKTTTDQKELKQINAEGVERMTTGGGTPAVGAAQTQPLPTGGNPYEAICRIINDPGTTTPSPGPGPGVPDIVNEKPAGAEDSEAKSKAAEETKKKKNLQRMMIGGAGGAIVLGVFGFIFGGPIGALAMGAIGFGIMAGVTHMNNNPIE